MAKTTIEFSRQSSEKLGGIARALSTTKTDVLRNALSLYSFVHKELQTQTPTDERWLAVVNDRDEVQKIIVVPGLQTRDVIEIKRRSRPANNLVVAASAGVGD